MMLGNLIHEMRRRRLWPIALSALVVAIAAPLLFLKSSPPEVAAPPAASSAPAAGKLPARAERLLARTDGTAARRSGGGVADPFEPPPSHRAAAAAAAKAASPGGGSTPRGSSPSSRTAPSAPSGGPVPVVITNAGNSRQPAPAAPIGDRDAKPRSTSAPSVDVRFGARWPTKHHRAIPRNQTFVARGRVIAVFVKYSPNRDKAVFAIAPATLVTGDVECRRKQGLCRYVDIPAGKFVRLTTLASDGTLVTRRLDVVRIGKGGTTAVRAASAAPEHGPCLLGKLLGLKARSLPPRSDTCGD